MTDKELYLLGPALAMLLIVTLNTPAYAEEDSLTIQVNDQSAELTVYFKKRPLMVYTFAANSYKPYVKKLFTLSGQNVLADAPPDHTHHHGMMYGIRVNGINFWEETAASGVQRPVKILKQQVGTNPSGLPRASFTQLIYWLDKVDRDISDATWALLVEQRTITLGVDAQTREVAVEWESTFEVGSKAKKVVLTGNFYNGLGLRFPKDFDAVAKHRNSENGPELHARKDIDISKARWNAVTFNFKTNPVTVVVFGLPTNVHGDALFFTMLAPFAYVSATQGLDKEPLEYAPGATFKLTYLVTVYSEMKTPEFLEQRAKLWSTEQPGALDPIRK